MTVDFRDRQYISQNATDPIGIVVHKAGVPADVDGDLVTVVMTRETQGVQVFSRPALKTDTGTYELVLTSADTSVADYVNFTFSYEVDTVEQVYTVYAEVGESAPAYDFLSPAMKQIVDNVWIRFADLFDSPQGGPNLLTYFQANWGRGRMAQLLKVAVGLLNTTAQPHQTYTLEDGQGGGLFPVDQWGPLLESALYVECLKHLQRSYVEQPAIVGASGITRLDRRDYMDRWGQILDDERVTLRQQLEVFKIANMNLGRPKVLVSGGVFGRFGPTRVAGSMAARPRYFTRFY